MSVGFEKAYLLQTDLNKGASDIIATYVYEQGVLKTQYSFSTAVGLFNTAINIVLLVTVNQISKRVGDVSLW
jgi:putative aldouronate transport system permease protein